MSGKISVSFLALFCGMALAAGTVYQSSLGKNAWLMSDWQMVKSPRSGYIGKWVQHEDMIVNKVPAGTDPATFITSARTTFTGMLFQQSFDKDVSISVDCRFAFRMAPGILIAAEPLRKNSGMAELAEHFEIILYDNGLNIWFHSFENGKPVFVKKASFLEKNCFAPNEFHRLTVKICTRKGKRYLEVHSKNKLLTCHITEMSGNFRIGIVGSEGVNSFRNIHISTP